MFFAVCGNENRDLNDQREVAVTEKNGDSSTFVRVLFVLYCLRENMPSTYLPYTVKDWKLLRCETRNSW